MIQSLKEPTCIFSILYIFMCMSNTQNITHANLDNFCNGCDQVYFNPLFRAVKYSPGIKFLSHNGAGWLIDAILSHAIHNPKVKREEFIVAKLTTNTEKHTAVLTFDDGNGNIVAKQVFDYTDFPLKEVSFYIENGLLCLPSER